MDEFLYKVGNYWRRSSAIAWLFTKKKIDEFFSKKKNNRFPPSFRASNHGSAEFHIFFSRTFKYVEPVCFFLNKPIVCIFCSFYDYPFGKLIDLDGFVDLALTMFSFFS